eukprot:TRINITY_DN71914_c0_g1_i1.p1 TRINITY_DN71914_c0_g1~~TRINITY_DN71914_c0_g1_i1.p1  ORF type:complete len:313 (-),score=57.79 TRINITY_DN71914_c0_g1_i1:474-1412(-)
MTYISDVVRDKKEEDPAPEESDDIVFDQTPVRVACPHCGHNIITFIEHESSWVTYAACLVLLMVLGWAALCVVPVVFPLFKDVVHHCPRCLNVLATRSRVVLPSPKQEVMSFRFGSCVVVLARKYVLLLVGLTTLIGGIHFIRTSGGPRTGVDALERTPLDASTWQDFQRDCGYKSYLGNPIHVSLAFDQKYKNKTFKWEGALHHVEEGLNFLWVNQKGAVFVRMDPPQFPGSMGRHALADLVLLYDNGSPVSKEIDKLKRGDTLNFEATMAEVGRRGSPHVMKLWELQRRQGQAASSPGGDFGGKNASGGA